MCGTVLRELGGRRAKGRGAANLGALWPPSLGEKLDSFGIGELLCLHLPRHSLPRSQLSALWQGRGLRLGAATPPLVPCRRCYVSGEGKRVGGVEAGAPASRRLGFTAVGRGKQSREGPGNSETTHHPPSLADRLELGEGHLCTSPQTVRCGAPSPDLALAAWEAGWLGGALGLVITGLPLSPPLGQLLAPPRGLRLGYRPHLPPALVPSSNAFGLSSWLSDGARSCPRAKGLMEQLVRGSVALGHPAQQPRAPAWHRLSASGF